MVSRTRTVWPKMPAEVPGRAGSRTAHGRQIPPGVPALRGPGHPVLDRVTLPKDVASSFANVQRSPSDRRTRLVPTAHRRARSSSVQELQTIPPDTTDVT
jgi:hypothetical protein